MNRNFPSNQEELYPSSKRYISDKLLKIVLFHQNQKEISLLGFFKSLWKKLIVSARRLIGSRIIESAAFCYQKLLAHKQHIKPIG